MLHPHARPKSPRSRNTSRFRLGLWLVPLLVAGLAGGARAETTERVSVGPAGVQANNVSDFPALSADGRFVAFQSDATNLVAGDTNFHTDIFVYDRQNDTIERVSVDSNGVQANDDCLNPAMSADGRFVAFESRATNLIANDTNGVLDVFVHDRTTGVTERVSVDSGGVERSAASRNAAISDDGRYVAFDGTNPNRTDVYVHDRTTGATALMSATSTGGSGNGNSGLAAISSDGRYVAFQSGATNLVPGDTNNDFDIFVRDRDSDGNGIFDEPGGTTLTLVTVDSNGTQSNGDSHNPAISADGRQVAFQSIGTNLVAGDTNAHSDIFVHDRVSGLTIRVSVGAGGVQGNGDSFQPSLSRDGRMVAFASKATNLVANDTNAKRDVFVYDRDTNNNGIFDEPNAVKMERASVDPSGVQGNNDSASIGRAVISELGGFVAFGSTATNLVANDTNARRDVFVHETTACGNGILTPDEQCDDGNLVDGDGCDSNCTFTACGNGIVTAGEQCDDGNLIDGDGCDSNCKPTSCGNGIVTAGEQCDDGNLLSGDGCDANCTFTACGNGIVTAGEQCDDGNLVDGDGCDSNCKPTGCGNGIVTAGEQCDDGNSSNNDACKNDCTFNVCGDGFVETGVEECDDGNLVNGDGCDSNCTVTRCGNGIVTAGEQCDDGNLVDGDGCDSNCKITACGNGIVTAGEQCDDGNLVDGDGCDSNCTVTACGNGIVTAGEQCDDGNLVDGDGCDSNCTVTACGNGIVTAGEQCDDGATNGSDHCCSGGCALIDFDGDGKCDRDDLSDLSGMTIDKITVVDTGTNPNRPNGIESFSGKVVTTGYPGTGGHPFFDQAKLTGFRARLYATADEPVVTDKPVVTLTLAATDCVFPGPVGGDPTSVRCKKVGPAPAKTTLKLNLRKTKTNYVLTGSIHNLDVQAPLAGPLHLVLNLNDPALLDYQGSVESCKVTGATKHTIVCKPATP